ncbi:MAG: arsenite methyltransferase [Phycisphaerales bacterium]
MQNENRTNPADQCCSDTCCGGGRAAPAGATINSATPAPHEPAVAESVRGTVRQGYAAIARAGSWGAASSGCCAPGGGCCGSASISPDQVAAAVGYADAELASIPEGANMGLSCGNPTALASLRAGEVVLDLGSGGGFDCFIAGPRVGPSGRVIGVDMTPEMVSKARGNLGAYRNSSGLENVEFRLGEIEHLPVADASVDVVISNCVLNLSPDKSRVWREIARVLKPGGRVAVSDLALLRPLPESVAADVEALVGCIAGAVLVDRMRADIAAAGLTDIVLTSKPGYIDAMTDSADPLYQRIVQSLPPGTRPSDFVTSLDVSARRAP